MDYSGYQCLRDSAEAWRTMPKATIAVVEGRACGGGSEIALSCDMRFALRGDALWPPVGRLAARIASFPLHAVVAAKASVLRAEHGVVADLQAEAAGFQGSLSGPGTRAAMARFLAGGGQTPDGEGRLGALCGDLHAPPGGSTPAGGAGPGSPG